MLTRVCLVRTLKYLVCTRKYLVSTRKYLVSTRKYVVRTNYNFQIMPKLIITCVYPE